MGNKAHVYWLTGFSGAGKTAIAEALHLALQARQRQCCILDGDVLRHGLCSDLGFDAASRKENMRRVGEVTKLLHSLGFFVVCAFISPLREDRDAVRALLGAGTFVEIHVATPLEECERRDVKGLYKKARAGEIAHFTGISAPYEPPEHAEVTCNTLHMSVQDCVAAILGWHSEKNAGFCHNVRT